jgi:hypothetical protein
MNNGKGSAERSSNEKFDPLKANFTQNNSRSSTPNSSISRDSKSGLTSSREDEREQRRRRTTSSRFENAADKLGEDNKKSLLKLLAIFAIALLVTVTVTCTAIWFMQKANDNAALADEEYYGSDSVSVATTGRQNNRDKDEDLFARRSGQHGADSEGKKKVEVTEEASRTPPIAPQREHHPAIFRETAESR